MDKMKEIQTVDNATGLKVFVNGDPDLSLIPDSLMAVSYTHLRAHET